MKELMTITIGQSPREDIQPILNKYIGDEVKITQMGILDAVSQKEYEKLTSTESSESIYVSKLSDGREITLDAYLVEKKVIQTIKDLEMKGFQQVLLLCTGHFPSLTFDKIRVYIPEKIIVPTIKMLSHNYQIGIMIPNNNQNQMMERKWGENGIQSIIETASPYSEIKDILKAGKKLKDKGAEYILMDCMGYTESMKELLTKELGLPVILSNALMAKVVSEILV